MTAIAALRRAHWIPYRQTVVNLFNGKRGRYALRTLNTRPPSLAFAFDIDGVLLRGKEVLPEAKRTLKVLEGDNQFGIKIPYILITNGGGKSEDVRCRALTEQLGVQIETTQFIQSHTVLKTVVDQYKDQHVMVLGGLGDDVRLTAESYGFRHVHTPLDVHAWNPSVWPFHVMTEYERQYVRPFDPSIPISAIFVFHDPRNWALDIQITCDILQSQGYVGDRKRHYESQALTEDSHKVKLVFCNPDLQWGAKFPVPRIGQGGFRIALMEVYKALNGSAYPYTQYGKPSETTYKYAENVLNERIRAISRSAVSSVKPKNIYMIGDNPESDIAGANKAGWSSVLVKTGVYSSGLPRHIPSHIAEHVEEAVNWAIQREIDALR